VVQNLRVLLITDPWLGVMSPPLKIKVWLNGAIHQQSHFLRLLLILLLGSPAVLEDVFLRFMPSIRAQKDFRLPADLVEREASSRLTGGFRFPPVARL
jgi:hypothetical protein